MVERIPALLTHVEIRSRHVRQNMQSMIDECTGILGYLSDPATLRALTQDHFRLGSPVFDSALAQHVVSPQQLQALLTIDESLLDQIIEPLVAMFAAQMPALLMRIKCSIPDMIKASHVPILNVSVSPAARARRFSALHYSVQRSESGDLPLGDSVVLFNVRGERSFKPFMDKDDELVHVILPLSSDLYLLGETDIVD